MKPIPQPIQPRNGTRENADGERDPIRIVCKRQNLDLDVQLVWWGKDKEDGSHLAAQAPPLYIHEKVSVMVIRGVRDNASLSYAKP